MIPCRGQRGEGAQHAASHKEYHYISLTSSVYVRECGAERNGDDSLVWKQAGLSRGVPVSISFIISCTHSPHIGGSGRASAACSCEITVLMAAAHAPFSSSLRARRLYGLPPVVPTSCEHTNTRNRTQWTNVTNDSTKHAMFGLACRRKQRERHGHAQRRTLTLTNALTLTYNPKHTHSNAQKTNSAP